MEISAITWNLFHGRDAPPDRSLHTLRSRLLRTTERNASHVQVNRDLYREFAGLLAAAEWDVALLQEAPPRWAEPLARVCGADHHRVLTSRNSLSFARAAIARANPDLIASGEGGSNLTLVRRDRAPGSITDRRELTIRHGSRPGVRLGWPPLTDGSPERRAMAFTRTSSGLCIANLHTTHDRPELAEDEVRLAAANAVAWAGQDPLIFGGDLNLRPGQRPVIFDELLDRFGLAAPTAPGAIDHLLVRGLEIAERPEAWPAERRELSEAGYALRLSDHAPVSATFAYDLATAAAGMR